MGLPHSNMISNKIAYRILWYQHSYKELYMSYWSIRNNRSVLIIPKLFLFGPYIDGWHYFPVLFRPWEHFTGIESLFNGIEFHTIQYHWNHLTFQWYWQYWNSILLNCNLYFLCPHFIQKISPTGKRTPDPWTGVRSSTNWAIDSNW